MKLRAVTGVGSTFHSNGAQKSMCCFFHGSYMGILLQMSLWGLHTSCGVTQTEESLMTKPNGEQVLLGSWFCRSVSVDQAWQNEMGCGGGAMWGEWR